MYETDPNLQNFIHRLENLAVGDLARLKRNAGKTLAESRNVIGLFYSLLPKDISSLQEEIYFMVATLFPLAEGGSGGNLGDSLRRARNTHNQKGLDRRVEILLDADTQQLPFRLRQTIHFLRSNRVIVNWYTLLDDLLFWNQPTRRVQQRWARAYFKLEQNLPNKGE